MAPSQLDSGRRASGLPVVRPQLRLVIRRVYFILLARSIQSRRRLPTVGPTPCRVALPVWLDGSLSGFRLSERKRQVFFIKALELMP